MVIDPWGTVLAQAPDEVGIAVADIDLARLDRIRVGDSGEVAWRDEVAARLLSKQQPDGSWVNDNPRWWETDRCLVTAYVLLSLELLHSSLPKA